MTFNVIAVALRKESVDRNAITVYHRARDYTVALRKESVDRNSGARALSGPRARRSPQGERG